MKALANLNNVEKAHLLHSLFPQEIPALLAYVQSLGRTIAEEQEHQRAQWDEGQLFSFDFWLSLAVQADKTITQYGRQLEKSAHLFADQLFDGYNALFMVHALTLFTTVRQHDDEKFTRAVQLLFT